MAKNDRPRVMIHKSLIEGWDIAIHGPNYYIGDATCVVLRERVKTKREATEWARKIREAIEYGYK